MIATKLKIFLILCLIITFGFGGPRLVRAQAEGEAEGEASDPVQARVQEDKQQTELEAQKLDELQRKDYEQCQAEANGSPAEEPSGTPADPNNPNPSDPNAQQTADEEATRKALEEAGYKVNHDNDCDGMTYQQYQTANGKSCTDVAGLPQHAIDRLGEIYQQAGCSGQMTITGGTEGGHSSHGVGRNVVDLERGQSCLNNYISQHTVSTSNVAGLGTYHQLDNGDQFLDEGDHWHADLRGGTVPGNSPIMALWTKLKEFFSPLTAEAGSATNLIEISGQLIDINNTSSTQLGVLIRGLNSTETNNLFGSMSPSSLSSLLNRLPFNALNQSMGMLNSGTLNQISGTLGQGSFNQIAGNLTDSTLNNIFSNLSGGSLSSLLLNTNSGPLSLVLGGLNSGSLNNVFSQISGGLANDLIGNLGTGAINNIFGNLGGDLANQVVSNLGITSLNSVFTNSGLSTINSLLPNLTSQTMGNLLPSLGSNAATQLLGGANPEILQDALSGVPTDVISRAAQQLPADLQSIVADKVPAISQALAPVLGPLSGALGPIGSLVGLGGLYVPVVEQGGQLMDLTKSIDKTDKEIKDLSIQICTHLKAIRRIQSRFEEKMVEDADVARIKATEIEKYRQALFGDSGVIKTGYTILDEDGEEEKGYPLFVVDNKSYIKVAAHEGKKIALDEISSTNNINNVAVLAGLQAEESSDLTSGPNPEDIKNVLGSGTDDQNGVVAKRPFDGIPILSTLLKPVRNTLAWLTSNRAWAAPDPPGTGQASDSDQFWVSFTNIVEKNLNVAYLKASNHIERKQNEAISAARDTAAQGQGFLPVRTCLAKTSDGKTCTVWGIVQPGIIVKETQGAALNSRLTQYENADSMGEVSQGNEPNVAEIINNKPSPGGGGAPGPGMVDPGSIPQQSNSELRSDANVNVPSPTPTPTPNPNPTPEGGGQDWTNFGNLLDSIMGGTDSPSSTDLNFLQQLMQLLTEIYSNQKPLIHFKAKALTNNQSLLYWVSPNATDCTAGNDWLSQTATASTTPKKQGDSLGKNANLTITYPSIATTSPSVIYKINCRNTKGNTAKNVTVEKRDQ